MINEKRDSNERIRLRNILESIEDQSQESGQLDEKDGLTRAEEAYNAFKIKYKNNIGFDPKARNLCKFTHIHYTYIKLQFMKVVQNVLVFQRLLSLKLIWKWFTSILTLQLMMRLNEM